MANGLEIKVKGLTCGVGVSLDTPLGDVRCRIAVIAGTG
jgi:hypothetical protein